MGRLRSLAIISLLAARALADPNDNYLCPSGHFSCQAASFSGITDSTIKSQRTLGSYSYCEGGSAYCPSNSAQGTSPANYQEYDLGWYPPGAKITVGTCGVPGGVDAQTSGDTLIRLVDGSGHEIANSDDVGGQVCPSDPAASRLQYFVSADASAGIDLHLRAGCYGSLACNATVAISVQYAHSGVTLDQLRPLAAGAVVPSKSPPEEYDMMTGGLTKIPVSTFYRATSWAVPAGNGQNSYGFGNVQIRADCTQSADKIGLVVTSNYLGSTYGPYFTVHYPGTYSANDTNAYYAAYQFDSATYNIYAFSLNRQTAYCTIEYNYTAYNGVSAGWKSIASGPSTSMSANPAYIGGTLIKVGALPAGDTLEVLTDSDGNGAPGWPAGDDTVMLLFQDMNDGNNGYNLPIFSDNRLSNDWDPSITVPNGFANMNTSYVLLGKAARTGSRNRAAETRVDLVHAPFDVASGCAAFAGQSGLSAPVQLPVGRYLMYVSATTANPVGSGSINPEMDVPGCGEWVCDDPDCTSQTLTNRYYRGRLNDDAFNLSVQYCSAGAACTSTSNNWTTLTTRVVPRAAVGGGRFGVDYSRFALPVEVPDATWAGYRWRLSGNNPNLSLSDISFTSNYCVARNPRTNELKYAQQNVGGDEADEPGEVNAWDLKKIKSTASILGTRGFLDPSAPGRVVEEPDRAPFEWDADIVALQEITPSVHQPGTGYTDPHHNAGYGQPTDITLVPGGNYTSGITSGNLSITGYTGAFDGALAFLQQAEANDSLYWSFVVGYGNRNHGCLFDQHSNAPAAAFIRQNAWPESFTHASVSWSPTMLNNASGLNCSNNDDDGHLYWENQVGAVSWCDLSNNVCIWDACAVPAMASARRTIGHTSSAATSSTPDQPVAVFSLKLQAAGGYSDRYDNVGRLISYAEVMLQNAPWGFNANNDTSPLGAHNRMIISGDANAESECGELQQITKRLRDAFGYAVMVNQAVDGSPDNKFDYQSYGTGTYSSPTIPIGYEMPQSGYYQVPTTGARKYGYRDPANPSNTVDASGKLMSVSKSINSSDTYPWWATTENSYSTDRFATTGQGSYQRIWLVGLGWAGDDPVQSYTILTGDPTPTPMSWDGKCVDLSDHVRTSDSLSYFHNDSCGAGPWSYPMYRPRCAMSGSGTFCGGDNPAAGDAAMNAEHDAIGAKLRIW